MTVRISRTERKALQREDATFLASPLAPNQMRAFVAHLRHSARLLSQRKSASPCAEAVNHFTALLERSIDDGARAFLACRSGCGFCCHQPVGVNAPEALLLAADIRRRAGMPAKVADAAKLLAGTTVRLPGAHWPRYPLLSQEGSCSVYGSRPLSCHGYVSVKVEDCSSNYEKPGGAEIGEPAIYRDVRDMCRMMMHVALRLNGLRDANYELSAAVTRVLETDSAETRWLDGEDILAGVPVIALTAGGESKVAHVTQSLAPTF